jgi:hypothetical protein
MSYLADEELRQVFESALRKDEKLLWAGRPKPGSMDTRFLAHTIFTCAWLVMFFFIGGGAFMAGLGAEGPIAIPFLIMPLVMLAFGLGIFVFTIAGLTAPRRELYAVTNKRIIIYGGRFERTFNSKMKGQISDVMRSGNSAIGTLKFRQGQDFGMISAFWMMSAPMDKFHNIERPVDVEALILENLFD